MIGGKSITLCTIDGANPEAAGKALDHCATAFRNFDEVLMIGYHNPGNFSGKFRQIHKLSYEGYAEYSIRNLLWDVQTDAILTIHPDGYILNPDKWNDEFLSYDYIGAPWPGRDWGGNSGFCIRSYRFLNFTNQSKFAYTGEHDDEYFFQTIPRKFMEEIGMRIAPREVAQKFSVECDMDGIDEREVFGFHQFLPEPSRRRPL